MTLLARSRATLRRHPWRAAALVTAVTFALGTSSSRVRLALATLRGPSEFARTSDARVQVEPGAEAAAKTIVDALPDAMRQVELELGPFAAPPAVFVCARQATFERYSPHPRARAHTLFRRVFVSPKPENTLERLPRLLVHELVHLHADQRLSPLRPANWPDWFSEGLAVLISGGAGAEHVSEQAGVEALCRGQRLDVRGRRSFWHHDYGAEENLPTHLFYREGALFVGFLRSRSRASFDRLIQRLEAGDDFHSALRDAFRERTDELWQDFLHSLPCASGSETQHRKWL